MHNTPVFRAGNTSPTVHSAKVPKIQMSELGPELEDTLPHSVPSERLTQVQQDDAMTVPIPQY